METPKNILRAIAGESMARNKYTFFASKAEEEGFEQIAAIFIETAENERAHAKRLTELLKHGESSSLDNFEFPIVEDTVTNLKHAAEGENFEHSTMYPEFAKVAHEEGLAEIAKVFEEIAEVEVEHEKRYLKLKKNIDEDKVFKKDGKVFWKCRNCGYVHEGVEAPEICPSCAHPQSYYELLAENY